MLVSEYVMQVIDNRQYKYATKQSYIKGIKSLGIWDLTVDSLSPQFFYQKLDTYTNLNTAFWKGIKEGLTNYPYMPNRANRT